MMLTSDTTRSNPPRNWRSQRQWLLVVAVVVVSACETKRETGLSGTSMAAIQGQPSASATIVDLMGLRDVRPISENSYWLPFLKEGFTTNIGERFGNAGVGPTWIRICWARSAQYSRMIDGRRMPAVPGAAQAIQWVREAVGATWMHYANIDFFHWDRMARWTYCTDEREPNRIVVGFSNVNFADQGGTTAAPTRILFDGNMNTREQYVRSAYNLFGRALNILPSSIDAFAPPTSADAYKAQEIYGLRRSGTLIEWGGQCVRDSVGDNLQAIGNVVRIDCNPYNDRVWRPMRLTANMPSLLGTTLSSGGTRCIQSFPDTDKQVTTGTCDTANPVAFSSVKWKATGNLCVAASSAAENASLQLQECDAAPALSRWNFEFLDPSRIVLAGAESCLAVTPVAAVEGAALTLLACPKISVRPSFTADAQVRFADELSAALEGDQRQPTAGQRLILTTSAKLGFASKFYVSGRITSGGRCVAAPTTPLGDVDWGVESRDCAEPPISAAGFDLDALEWDYHW